MTDAKVSGVCEPVCQPRGYQPDDSNGIHADAKLHPKTEEKTCAAAKEEGLTYLAFSENHNLYMRRVSSAELRARTNSGVRLPRALI